MNPEFEASPGFLLHDVSRLLRRNFSRRIQSLGLTQAQCRTLLHLARNEGLRQVDLAEILEVQPITLARLIDQLAELELVERRPDPADRRAFRLVLTRAAKSVLAQIRALGALTWADATADVGPARMTQFSKTLLDLKRNLLAAEPAPPVTPAIEKERNVRARA
jgi:MarR family transcriptional regulator, transcriptional regulator for hemolysin